MKGKQYLFNLKGKILITSRIISTQRLMRTVSNPQVKALSKFEEEIEYVEEFTGLGLEPR